VSRFIYLAMAVSAILGYSGTAAGMGGSTSVEGQLDALTDAVCVQAVIFNNQHQQWGRSTPKVCRDAQHIVFVSSATYSAPGDAGDAAAKCNQLDADADLPGIYAAWITGESRPDINPPAFFFTLSFGPYVLVDGTVVANNSDDLTDGILAAPISVNEKGESTSVEVWTNVAVDGTRPTKPHAEIFTIYLYDQLVPLPRIESLQGGAGFSSGAISTIEYLDAPR
jgi:hypothetical protein